MKEIEVTPAMLRAGLDAVYDSHNTVISEESLAAGFRAMLRAQQERAAEIAELERAAKIVRRIQRGQ